MKNGKLSAGNRVFLICVMCLLSMPVALAQKHHPRPEVSIGGVYENLTAGRESGDLEGMRVVILAAGGAYRAIVQIAQGGAEDPKPEFVDVEAKGMNVSFTVGEQKFTGTVTAAGLRLKDAGLLARKPCSAYFNAGP
ncbi:MAG TPA: hypothetical protein VD861_13460 [Pyrinomonadaceae bacterium]|nr:hypothetical protein [Pyrinomonadaceae bacterium]